ncbi:hypothetical protein VBY75_03635 [Idiomarina sp. HB]|uniref:hypothetical protein n=1 Tax=Idiomarina sp. HB TaxID=3110479 RepID=UPI003A81202A
MASGTSNKLTGQVGEHLVSAVLGTLGYYASPYSGNVPGFDVTAVHSESLKSFPVQVKASTRGALVQSTIDKWCNHSIDKNNRQTLGELTPLKHPDLIWILVRLPDSGVSGARFFICTERDIQKKIVDRYVAFMEKHDYRRPGGGASPQAILNIKDVAEFENNWEMLSGYQ